MEVSPAKSLILSATIHGGSYFFIQPNKSVHIGENVWVGAGTVIVPGVTIGKNSVIRAGSVVVKDIPENVVAVGNPCRVLREIGEHDREFFYRNERIDWENLK